MKAIKRILQAQRNEITEHYIYNKLSLSTKEKHNKKILGKIANDELKHYNILKRHTKKEIKPNRLKIWKYYIISKLLGLTFGVKLMENGEKKAQISYATIGTADAKNIAQEEKEHEKKLIDMIDEERLKYVSSIVLGLNDALVELTGALAGFSLALQQTKLVAITGLITGIAASLSMGASEYLSTQSEGGQKNPLKASIYTTFAYVLTVMFLISPYLIFKNVYFALFITLLNAIIVILVFTFYISVAKDFSFKKRFWEMALVSLSVAAVSFGIGLLVRLFFNVEV